MVKNIKEFTVAIDNSALEDLTYRINHARWSDREIVSNWDQGVPYDFLREVSDYWAQNYQWRKVEEKINSYTNILVNCEDIDFHVLISENSRPHSIPLLLLNGWPSSVCEYFTVISGLQSLDVPLTIVYISMPGYGFSSKPTVPGWNMNKIAQAFVAIMEQLGFSQFLVHGSDLGSMIAAIMGTYYPDVVLAVHATMPFANRPQEPMELDEKDQRGLRIMQDFDHSEAGFSKIQSTRPQTLGYALTDSAIGQLAWILEKFWFWSDHGDNLFRTFSLDHILDTVSIYWFTASATSSARSYWECRQNFHHLQFDQVHIPVGFTIGVNDARMPRSWCQKRFTDLRYWHDLEEGGHFLAAEKPHIFLEEINNFIQCIDL